MKTFDYSQTTRTGERNNILPLFITQQDFCRDSGQLSHKRVTFEYLPHANNILSCLWYVNPPSYNSSYLSLVLDQIRKKHFVHNGNTKVVYSQKTLLAIPLLALRVNASGGNGSNSNYDRRTPRKQAGMPVLPSKTSSFLLVQARPCAKMRIAAVRGCAASAARRAAATGAALRAAAAGLRVSIAPHGDLL